LPLVPAAATLMLTSEGASVSDLTAISERSGGVQGRASDAVRVLAVDDQEIFLRAVRALIAATPGFEQVGEARSGTAALELAAQLHPDLVLLDVRMPDMDGLETARRMADIDPDAIVILISLEEVSEVESSAGSGCAHGYLRKQELSTHALRAIWTGHDSHAR
jgi:DNA-binding NarL/FixJ family response regulator